MENLPVKYTRTDLENAETKGQVIGLLQGAGLVVAGVLLLKIMGWIPTILVIGGVGFLAYKLLRRPKRDT